MTKNLFLLIAILTFSGISQAMQEETNAHLPSARMLKLYLANEPSMRNLENAGIRVLDALCEQFGEQVATPDDVHGFIWQKIEEQRGEELPKGIDQDVNKIVEKTFQDDSKIYKTFFAKHLSKKAEKKKTRDVKLF